MHLTLFITLAITTLTQRAVGQTIDPSKIDDTTKSEILTPNMSSNHHLILYRPMVQ